MSDAERCEQHEQAARDAAGSLVDEAMHGNLHAIVSVIKLAEDLCRRIDEMTEGYCETAEGVMSTPDAKRHIYQIAQFRDTWPGLLSAHPAAIDDAQALLSRLQLGRRHRYAKTFGVPQGSKRARMDSAPQAISIECRDAVVRLIQRAEDKAEAGHALAPEEAQARALPPLAKASFDEWFSLGWREWCATFVEQRPGATIVEEKHACAILGSKAGGDSKRSPQKRVERAVRQASKWWYDSASI